MKPQKSKLEQVSKQETAETEKSTGARAAHEFQSAEEMLRVDATQTPVPESVRTRLAESVRHTTSAEKARPWWKRLLS